MERDLPRATLGRGTVLGLDKGAGPRVTRCGASRNRAVDGMRPAVTDARASGGVNG